MPRLAAFLLLAGVAVSALPRRRPRLTPTEHRLLIMPMASRAVH